MISRMKHLKYGKRTQCFVAPVNAGFVLLNRFGFVLLSRIPGSLHMLKHYPASFDGLIPQ
jgi:hypothetical protein